MFTTLYDIRSEGLSYIMTEFLVVGICLFVIGFALICLWKANLFKAKGANVKLPLVGFGMLGISMIFLFISLSPLFWTPGDARYIFDNKLYQVVEGMPVHYHPMPKEGHDEESFELQGVRFHYGDYSASFGYSNAASHGGVIHPGNYYRITYFPDQDSLEAGGPSILKIEVKKIE